LGDEKSRTHIYFTGRFPELPILLMDGFVDDRSVEKSLKHDSVNRDLF
jgi:hypothetical protein